MKIEQLLSKIVGSLDTLDFPPPIGVIYSYCYLELTGSNDYWRLISFSDSDSWASLREHIEENFDDIDFEGEDVSEIEPVVKMWPVFLAENQFEAIQQAVEEMQP